MTTRRRLRRASCPTPTEPQRRNAIRRVMRGVRRTKAFAAGLLAAAAAGAQPQAPQGTPAAPEAAAPMAEVVAEGEHAGPRMWTVRSGAHVLWILGTITPLPKKMIWQ